MPGRAHSTAVDFLIKIVRCNALTCTCYTGAACIIPLRSSADGSCGSSINTAYGSFDYSYIRVAPGGNISMDNCTSTGFRLLTCVDWKYAGGERIFSVMPSIF